MSLASTNMAQFWSQSDPIVKMDMAGGRTAASVVLSLTK